ncbi:hypothetical protein LINPERPRIM_LOCUS41609 [Linum perenne]
MVKLWTTFHFQSRYSQGRISQINTDKLAAPKSPVCHVGVARKSAAIRLMK